MTNPPTTATPPNDLGFGAVVTRESRRRLLNRDGSFNVRRHGLRFLESLSTYHWLLTLSWPRFFAVVAGGYLGGNLIFAMIFLACGPGALQGAAPATLAGRFAEAFFFSLHTLATIGYGNVSPASLAANIVVAGESLVGLLGFAVAAGLMFARFSRPNTRIVFSRHAVIAPYRGKAAFEFRIANARTNQLLNVEAKVVLARRAESGEGREFHELALERHAVAFFPLTWTIVHPIDERSPLHGVTVADLAASEAEFLVLLTAFDETFSQAVYARSSYAGDEIVFGARFSPLLRIEADGGMAVDVRRLHELEAATVAA